jgi:small nuclear ribonucleoprotein (snRNP)-like protein
MVKDILKKSLKTRKVLIQLKADKNFPEQLNALEQQQITIIKTIEQQDAEGAKNAEKSLVERNAHARGSRH